MRRFGVHLNALRAFEAAARHCSFTLAAEELCVSHSTVSHHIKGLEKTLGVDLFLRQNRTVVLTSSGEMLLPVLKNSFDRISTTLETIKNGDDQAPLRITLTPSFANKWFIPRLHRFTEANEGIEVELKQSLSSRDFERTRFDVGVRFGLGEWPGLKTELLLPIRMTPLCSPKVLQNGRTLESPSDLVGRTFIHADTDDARDSQSEWQTWLDAMGSSDIDCRHGLSFQDPGLALNAARDGLGIAMGYLELAADDLESGQLVRPFAAEVQHHWPYYIVVPESKVDDPQVQIFCEWLRSETKTLRYSPPS